MADFGSALGGLFTGLAQGAEAGISLSQKQQTIELQKQQGKIQAIKMLDDLDKWSPALRKTAGPSALKYLFKTIGIDDMTSVQPMIDIYTKDDGGEQKSAMLGFIAKTLNESPGDIAAIFKNMNMSDIAKVGAQMSTMKRGADLDAFRRSGYSSTDLVYDEYGRVVGRRTSKGIISVPGAVSPPPPPAATTTPSITTPQPKLGPTPTTPLGPLPDKTNDQKAAEVTGLLDTANRGPQIQPEGVPRSALAPKPTTIPLEMDKGPQKAETPAAATPVQYTKPDQNWTTPQPLKTAPVGIQAVIKGQGEYRIKPPDTNTAQGRAAMAKILEAYPDYDPSKFAARNAFITGLAKGSIDGRTIDSFRTLTGHLQTLATLGDALKSNDVRAINAIANAYGVQTGSDAVTNYNLVGRAVALEVMNALRRSGQPSERETNEWAKLLQQPSMSAPQIEGAIKNTWHIVGQRFAGMAPRINEAYQGQYPFFPKGSQTEAAKNYLDSRYGLKTEPGAPASEVPGPTPPGPQKAQPAIPDGAPRGTKFGGWRGNRPLWIAPNGEQRLGSPVE